MEFNDNSWRNLGHQQCTMRTACKTGHGVWAQNIPQNKKKTQTKEEKIDADPYDFLLLFTFLIVLFFLQPLRVLFLISPVRTLYNRIRDHCRISSLCNLNPSHYLILTWKADMQPATSATYLGGKNTIRSRDAKYSITQVT
jgi:hypothetical protein